MYDFPYARHAFELWTHKNSGLPIPGSSLPIITAIYYKAAAATANYVLGKSMGGNCTIKVSLQPWLCSPGSLHWAVTIWLPAPSIDSCWLNWAFLPIRDTNWGEKSDESSEGHPGFEDCIPHIMPMMKMYLGWGFRKDNIIIMEWLQKIFTLSCAC